MARRRLRHKLMLGLALVAGSVGAIVAGAGYGIYAYYSSTKSIDKKLYELGLANQIIESLNSLDQSDQLEPALYLQRVTECSAQLKDFKTVNDRTVAGGHDPDGGAMESGLTATLSAQLKTLEGAVNKAAATQIGRETSPGPLRQQKEVRDAHAEARRTAENLRHAIIDDIQTTGRSSNAAIQQSIWWVGLFFVWAVALVLTMLYYFRAWMFAPIREIQAGVQRVHGGNFAQPIALASGDELQELADEFNAMVARLHAVYADLARQVNERSRQLVRSERMVSVGFLAAGVAHEINNPLASILFCSEALERRLQEVLGALAAHSNGALPAEAEVLTRYLKMIQQEALRCKDITQKLLDFSRTGVRRKEPADLTGLVRGVLEVARHLPSSRGKAVQFEPSGYIVAPVNAQDLKSVILNLVVNALDSMDDGGRLSITLTAAGGYAELVFADTGCGTSPDVLQNIFEPFYTKSRTGKGTGLGLFISHQIVDQHGGTITAASSGPGTGSTFTVRIPLQLAAGEAESQADPDESPNVLAFPGGNREAA
ncbi:MAG: HAMP domain-containing histidine kinase [Planctomycetes bacterium]|nr:HAMP domain-containing histidine kinase [Planctomycetota bacterium]